MFKGDKIQRILLDICKCAIDSFSLKRKEMPGEKGSLNNHHKM